MTYQKLSKLLTDIKPGRLVTIEWLDAVFTMDKDEHQEQYQKDGGIILYTSGHLVAFNENGITVCAELNKDKTPSRDFNTIPLGMVKGVTTY